MLKINISEKAEIILRDAFHMNGWTVRMDDLQMPELEPGIIHLFVAKEEAKGPDKRRAPSFMIRPGGKHATWRWFVDDYFWPFGDPTKPGNGCDPKTEARMMGGQPLLEDLLTIIEELCHKHNVLVWKS